MAGEPGEILTELQEKLLSRFEEVVGETFYYSVVEGFWSGPASAHWARKLKKVQAWEAHQDESIRVFARKVRKEIERILELERREEDEDEVAP